MQNFPEKYFNVAGPCNAKQHYMIDGFKRGADDMIRLIERGQYFVLHAARQSGKTTLLMELVNYLNKKGDFCALYCSLEAIQSFPDPEAGIPEIVKLIKASIEIYSLPEGFARDADYSHITGVLKSSLTAYCRSLDKPLVIFFDEADCMTERTLVTFLRQLRDGFVNRANIPFVHSIALVGMRNIRDFKAKVRPDYDSLGSSSPFNIVTKAFGLSTFTYDEIKELYSQHTSSTGQVFQPDAIDFIFEQTDGQPWLVNAIAREAIEEILKEDYTKPVTKELAEIAIQNLLLARGTHFDSLMERLKENRVRNIIKPLILGEDTVIKTSEDYLYTRDLGIIKSDGNGTKPANPIYAELIIRALSCDAQDMINDAHNEYNIPRYIKNGKIDIDFLMQDFQGYWRENSDIWIKRYETDLYQYDEAAPHLVLQAFLQRVINGGGQIIREMALGKKRMDLCVVYEDQKYPIELKILRNEKTIADGLKQTYEYMTHCGCDNAHLVVFDRDSQKSWDEKIYMKTENYNGKQITVVGA